MKREQKHDRAQQHEAHQMCLNVSIQAPGFGKKRIKCGKAPINRYGDAMPSAMQANSK